MGGIVESINVMWFSVGLISLIVLIWKFFEKLIEKRFDEICFCSFFIGVLFVLDTVASLALGYKALSWWWSFGIFTLSGLFFLIARINERISLKKARKERELKDLEYKKLDEEWDNKKD